MALTQGMYNVIGTRLGGKSFFVGDLEAASLSQQSILLEKFDDSEVTSLGPAPGTHLAAVYSFDKCLTEEQLTTIFQKTNPRMTPKGERGCPMPAGSFLCLPSTDWHRSPTGGLFCYDDGGSLLTARLDKTGSHFATLTSELPQLHNEINPLEFTIAGRFGTTSPVESKSEFSRVLLTVTSVRDESYRLAASSDLSKSLRTYTF